MSVEVVENCSQSACMPQFFLNSFCSGAKNRLLEFYCGVGGMRYAIEAAGIPYEVVAAIDVNPVVNAVYQHNFGMSGHMQRNIQSFTTEEVENMKPDIITMSPPCQPFTRIGLKKDTGDARSSSFLHLLNIIMELKKKPRYFLLENVKGFEDSLARDALIQTLRKCGYVFQEFLLSPSHFGIPNSRLRYYIVAKSEMLNFVFPLAQQVRVSLPIENEKYSWSTVCARCKCQPDFVRGDICSLKHFLVEKPKEYCDKFCVSDDILSKYWTVLDIVDENSHNSCCFTKAYSRYALGTGSVLHNLHASEISEVFDEVAKTTEKDQQLCLLKSLKLRYFTPREIANIMCFPDQFSFPEHLTLKQMYKCLGNSINVFVVACLIDALFQE